MAGQDVLFIFKVLEHDENQLSHTYDSPGDFINKQYIMHSSMEFRNMYVVSEH